MARKLPPRPHLELLKSRAKDLRKAHRQSDPETIQRIGNFHPHWTRASASEIASSSFSLQDAQLVIAREYGFDSWPKLVAKIAVSTAENLLEDPEDLRAQLEKGNWFLGGDHPEDFAMGVDRTVTHRGKASTCLKSKTLDSKGSGILSRAFKADRYRGKRLRMSAYVKTENVEKWVGLWMSLGGPPEGPLEFPINLPLRFDNMRDRPIRGTTDWKQYTIVLDVPPDSEKITFGLLLVGKGLAWVDDLRFEDVGDEVPTTDPWRDAKPEDDSPVEVGTLLAATNKLTEKDPNFSCTLVLILRHDGGGTMGIVTNRPLDERDERYAREEVRSALEALQTVDNPPDEPGAMFFHGGPIAVEHLFFLHRSDGQIEGSTEIIQDLHIGGDLQSILSQRVSLNPTDPDLRFYLGCATWGPGQLAAEIANGSWHLCPASIERVFTSRPDTIWQEVLDSLESF